MPRSARRLDWIARRQVSRCQRVDLRLARLGLLEQATVPLRSPAMGARHCDQQGGDQQGMLLLQLLRQEPSTVPHRGRWLN